MQTLDEDYESAVKALNGKLYPDPPEAKAAACGDGMQPIPCYILCTSSHILNFSTSFSLNLNLLCASESDCQVVWEKKPTPEEEEKAKSLQLPATFFCGLSTTDSDPDQDKSEDFETEVRKVHEVLVIPLSARRKYNLWLKKQTF